MDTLQHIQHDIDVLKHRITLFKKSAKCDHEWIKQIPEGFRDNNEYFMRCIKCRSIKC